MNVILQGQVFYTNNPVYVRVTNIPLDCMKITYSVAVFEQVEEYLGLFVKPVEVYTNGRPEIYIDVSKIAKLYLFSEPHHTDYSTMDPVTIKNNYRSVQLVFSFFDYDGELMDSKSLSKRFIRGGKRLYTNNVIAENGNLIPTEQIPVWGAFPVDLYYLDSDNLIKKTNVISNDLKDRRDVKGCNGLYVKFLNSKGGFSYWLFENFNLENSNRHLGTVDQMFQYLDLGSEFEPETINAISKVPRKYYPLIEDLIYSNEIYIYVNPALGSGNVIGAYNDPDFWERVYSYNNKISINNLNSIERFNLKFRRQATYNGTLIW